MNKTLFLKELFLDIVLPGMGLGLSGLIFAYYVLPKIFRPKRRNEESEKGQ